MTDAGRRVSLVTGGTSGIGLGVARALVARGETVVVLGRDADRCTAAGRELRAGDGGGDVVALVADVTDHDRLDAVVEETVARYGKIDHLVTAAGRLARGDVLTLPTADLRAALETNVVGTWATIRAVLPSMTAHGYGRIVTVGSVLGSVGAPERGGYAATKAAVHAITRSVALETAGTGVTVNCVAPGPTRTAMNAGEQDTDAAAQAAFTAKVPLGRWATPGDIAAATLLLLDPANGFMTGSVVAVDGGYTAQ